MASTSKSTWTAFERAVAARDWDSVRTPLSGENSRHGGGDVIIRDEPYLVECKLRAAFAHHALYADVRADAKKHGKNHAVLYTKKKHDHGWLVTVDGDLFTEMLRAYRERNALADPA